MDVILSNNEEHEVRNRPHQKTPLLQNMKNFSKHQNEEKVWIKLTAYLCRAANLGGTSSAHDAPGMSLTIDFQVVSSSSNFFISPWRSANFSSSDSALSLRPFSSSSFTFNNSMFSWDDLSFLASRTSASWWRDQDISVKHLLTQS